MTKSETITSAAKPAAQGRAARHCPRRAHRAGLVRRGDLSPAWKSAAQRLRSDHRAGRGIRAVGRRGATSGGWRASRWWWCRTRCSRAWSGTETSQVGDRPGQNRRLETRTVVPRLPAGGGARWIAGPRQRRAIARAAEAFGATGLLFLKGTVSPHNPKTLPRLRRLALPHPVSLRLGPHFGPRGSPPEQGGV